MMVAGAGLRFRLAEKTVNYDWWSSASNRQTVPLFLFRRIELFAIYGVLVCGILCYVYNERCFNIFVLCGYLKQNELLVSSDDLFPISLMSLVNIHTPDIN